MLDAMWIRTSSCETAVFKQERAAGGSPCTSNQPFKRGAAAASARRAKIPLDLRLAGHRDGASHVGKKRRGRLLPSGPSTPPPPLTRETAPASPQSS
ncbi:hypothetical protein HPB50_008999 [Hyalomma asiaticum]|uniref:Uncharacterized protein n=1 Tax=Hyalomma asiaticum TaxID=266040 RepID=A0ACB7S803_HYAAI|nr:hypothetical protein HPB50_008999 [Hyalomma asiaticum]